MVTLDERIARMEGVQEHLATKADLAQMEMRLLVRLGAVIVAVSTIAGAVVVVIDRL